MNTTTIAKSVKYETGIESTEAVEIVGFEIGHTTHHVVFERNPSYEKIVREIKKIVKETVRKAKNFDIIKIGDYDITVQEVGCERIVYANDEVISKTKVSVY